MTAPFRVLRDDEPVEAEAVRLRLIRRPACPIELDPADATLGGIAGALAVLTDLTDAEIAAAIPSVTAAVVAGWRAGTAFPSAACLLALVVLAGPVGLTLLGRLVLPSAEVGAVGGGCRA
jgi:hypothetical protein